MDIDIAVGEGISSYIGLFFLKPHSRIYLLISALFNPFLLIIHYENIRALVSLVSSVYKRASVQPLAVAPHCACALASRLIHVFGPELSINRDASVKTSVMTSPRHTPAGYRVLVSLVRSGWVLLSRSPCMHAVLCTLFIFN